MEEGKLSDDSDDNDKMELCLRHEFIRDNFDVKRKLGSGGFGSVYEAKNRNDSKEYALKFVRIDKLDVAKREVEALASLKHDNIVRYWCSFMIRINCLKADNDEEDEESDSRSIERESTYDSTSGSESTFNGKGKKETNNASPDENDSLSIVFDESFPNDTYSIIAKIDAYLVIQTDLYDQNLTSLLEEEKLNDIQRLQICFDIALGLKYIHDKGFMHRDLKPSNILLDKDNRAKIGDFGFAIKLSTAARKENIVTIEKSSLTEAVGTVHYVAPEIRKTNTYDQRVDLYSLGVIVFEIFCKMDTKMERNEILQRLANEKSMFNELKKNPEKNPYIHKILISLLNHDPSLRMDLKQVIEFLKFEKSSLTSHKSQCNSVPFVPANRTRTNKLHDSFSSTIVLLTYISLILIMPRVMLERPMKDSESDWLDLSYKTPPSILLLLFTLFKNYYDHIDFFK